MKPQTHLMAQLAAPARHMPSDPGLITLAKFAKRTKGEAMALHAMGPNAVGKLRAALWKAGLAFSPGKP